jgi:hypothetical protein
MLRLVFLPALASAFNFGGFQIPISLPPLPTALPSIRLPEIPSELSKYITQIPSLDIPIPIPSIPSDIGALVNPTIPAFNITSRIPIPSIPDDLMHIQITQMPPLESLFNKFSFPAISLPPIPTDFEDIRKSLGITPFPTIRIPSQLTLPTPPPFNPDDIRDALGRIGRDNRTLKVPESEAELRDLIGRQTRFDLKQADDFVDRLGAATGYDVHASIRMISGLVLTNESFSSVYERSTAAFRLAAARLEGDARSFNLSGLQVILPALGLPANQTISVMQWARNPYEALSSQPLNSSVVSIMIADAVTGNETRIAGLRDLLNFTVPVDGLGHLSRMLPGSMSDIASCVYWNGTEWSGEGCQALRATDFEVTCGCTHLTDFAVILTPPQSLVAVPSPSVQPIYESLLPSSGPHLLIVVPSATAEQSKSPLIIGLSVGGCLLIGAAIGLTALNIKHKRAKEKVIAAPPWAWKQPTAFPVKDLESQVSETPNAKSAIRASTTKNVLAQISVRK